MNNSLSVLAKITKIVSILAIAVLSSCSSDDSIPAAPEAKSQNVSIEQGKTQTITLTTVLAQNQSITKYNISPLSNGGSLTGSGAVYVYNPPSSQSNFTGVASFTFSVMSNTDVFSNSATVTINVVKIETPTIKVLGTPLTVAEDTTLTITFSTTVTSGRTLSYKASTPSFGGRLIGSGDNLQYVPKNNYNGNDSFTYTVTDNQGLGSTPLVVSLTITPVNDKPTVSAGAVQSVQAGSSVTITASSTDIEDPSSSLTYLWQSDVNNSPTIMLSSTSAKVTTFKAPDVLTSTSFTFVVTVTDSSGATATDSVVITVVPVSRLLLGPIANANIYVSLASSPSVIIESTSSTSMVGNDLSTAGNFIFNLTGRADNEWLLIVGSGGMDLDANDDGIVDATPTMNSGRIRALAQVKTARTGINVSILSELVTQRVLASVVTNTQVTIDPNSDMMLSTLSSAQIMSEANKATNKLVNSDTSGDSKIDYIDALAYFPSSVIPTIKTPSGTPFPLQSMVNFSTLNSLASALENSNTTNTVSIAQTIFTAINVTPTLVAQNITTTSGVSVAFTISTTDDGGIDAYHFSPKTRISGTAPNFVYTPLATFTGTDTIQVSVTDNDGVTSSAKTLSIHVTSSVVNNTPTLVVSQNISTTSGVSVAFTITATDDGSITSYNFSPKTQISGTAPNFVYTPLATFTGTDTIQVSVTDNNGVTSSTKTLSIIVSNSTTQPITTSARVTAIEGISTTFSLTPFFTVHSSRTISQYNLTNLSNNGTLSRNGATLTYTPPQSNLLFNGDTSFTFSVIDSTNERSNTATITIEVRKGVSPTVSSITATLISTPLTGGSTHLNLSAIASTGRTVASYAVALPSSGTLIGTGASRTYTASIGFSGTISFTYTATDNLGVVSTVPGVININSVLDSSASGSRPVIINPLTDIDLPIQQMLSITIPPNTCASHSGVSLMYQMAIVSPQIFILPGLSPTSQSPLTWSGIPSQTGTFTALVICATEGSNIRGSQQFNISVVQRVGNITINKPLSSRIIEVGKTYNYNIPTDTCKSTASGSLSYSGSFAVGKNPLNLSISGGSISGTPSNTGTSTVNFTCTDTATDSISGSFQITAVSAPPAEDAEYGITIIPQDPIHSTYVGAGFNRYLEYLPPNKMPIRIYAQPNLSTTQIVRAYRILDFWLTNVGRSLYGSDKASVANQMGINKAVLLLPNGSHDSDIGVNGQPIYETENVVEGSARYLDGKIRDAAYEEILHLVHDNGIGVDGTTIDGDSPPMGVLPLFQAMLRTATNNALQNSSIWSISSATRQEWTEENSLTQEYLANLLDAYYGLNSALDSTARPTEYIHNTRADMVKNDPMGYALIGGNQPRLFFSDYVTYLARIDSSFSGDFMMTYSASLLYTNRSQYLLNAELTGSNNSNLIGNDRDNDLKGNTGNNLLDGKGGKDTALYDGNYSQYTLVNNSGTVTVTDKVSSRDGVDTLKNIEFIQFADRVAGLVANSNTIIAINTPVRNVHRLPISEKTTLDNSTIGGSVTLVLNFRGDISNPDGTTTSSWTTAMMKPYLEAASEWLRILKSAGNIPDYFLELNFQVASLGGSSVPYGAGGVAVPILTDVYRDNSNVFFSEGNIVINTCNYTAVATTVCPVDTITTNAVLREKQTKETIFHEIGHIMGIGSLWNLNSIPGDNYSVDLVYPVYDISLGFSGAQIAATGTLRTYFTQDTTNDFFRYSLPTNSVNGGVANYNAATTPTASFNFAPVSSGTHLYSNSQNSDGLSRSFSGTPLHSLDTEIMASGTEITSVLHGFLRDLGWVLHTNAPTGSF